MKKALITGSNGMLGQDLYKILYDNNIFAIETDVHNMDITDLAAVKEVIEGQKPDYVIHAAAYTNVDGAETDKDTAFLINKTGTENIARITGYLKIPTFYISTDYVFDGTKNTPYKPDDQVCPINIYGESKLAGEIALKNNNPKHYIFRTSWLYGHKGKNFVETMIRLAQSHPELKVVADQRGCPTWTVELAKVILKFIQESRPYGIYHVCGSGETTWHEFAQKIMEFMNIDIPVIPVTSEEYPRPAKRPAYSIMDNAGLCPDWQESLKEYIKLRSE